MYGYIARRLVQLVFVLIGVSIITFLIMFLIPGNPAYLLAGKNATPQRVAEISVELGLNKPIYVQYGRFVDRLVHGNFGESYQFERPVRQMLQSAIPNTAQLAVAAVLIELLGIPLGIYSALRQYTIWDSTLTTTALIIWGIPVFVLAVFMQYVFGVYLGILPFYGTGGSTFLWVIPADWNNLSHLILPAVTLGIIEVAYISYMQRASMLEVIRSDYVRTARAKGLSERSVILKHSLKNAAHPSHDDRRYRPGRADGRGDPHRDGVRALRRRSHGLPGHRRPRPARRCRRCAVSPHSSTSSPTWWSTWRTPMSTRASAMSEPADDRHRISRLLRRAATRLAASRRV